MLNPLSLAHRTTGRVERTKVTILPFWQNSAKVGAFTLVFHIARLYASPITFPQSHLVRHSSDGEIYVKKFGLGLIGLLIAGALVAGLTGIKLDQFKTMGEAGAKHVMPATPVNSLPPREIDWARTTCRGLGGSDQGTTHIGN